MAFAKKHYNEIVEDVLARITKGVVNERHEFVPGKSRYLLSSTPAGEIIKIEGTLNATNTAFKKDRDYALEDNSIAWKEDGEKPDDSTYFLVNYIFGDSTKTAGITDINPGSVARTLVEAVGREIDFVYEEMNQIYLSGFIDTARGSALDMVVSILGIERKPPERAGGSITFGRNTPPGEISKTESIISDGRKRYVLKNAPVKNIIKISGTVNSESTEFEEDTGYRLIEGEKGILSTIEFLNDSKKPDIKTVFNVEYAAYEKIIIPGGTVISTAGPVPENVKTFKTGKEAILLPSKEDKNRWLADVFAVSEVPGKQGNVNAGAVTVMPKPPVGIEYVINKNDILTGSDEESDYDLKKRAKHALEAAGKATYNSLKTAVMGVEGVNSAVVEDMPEGVSGVVKIIADGGWEDEIKEVIENTRSAGIKVEFYRPRIVDIGIELNLKLRKEVDEISVKEIEPEAKNRVKDYIDSLDIGEDVIYNQVINRVLDIEEILDVIVKVNGAEEDVEIASDEMVKLKNIDVFF
ncbi:hypothetical protein BEH94_09605 [Candidatus Altiarchaeales archaeon WOR_SM1_SCG]|nr:hypothetical protein BEH94_09605 [Candidatus Altiarchaeales archaeon WOR_SM1_SCG]